MLSERELESRFEVMVEQYTTQLNIEAETAASIARTMLLPAAVRHLGRRSRRPATTALVGRDRGARRRVRTTRSWRWRRPTRDHPAEEGLELAKYMRDNVVPAMDAAREVADRLERIVADDLWPLPKYSEMLFIK